MGKLTARRRNALKATSFAGPDRSYPIPDVPHARNALARAAQHASPDLKAKITDKVHQKFPAIKIDAGEPKSRQDRPRRK